jgi:hypothetical protein
MESLSYSESVEKPKFVYHGSVTGNIDVFEPRKRYVPSGANVPPRVYAAINPAFAAAHSFPWSSDEGIDLSIEGEKVVLCIPERFKDRLSQFIYIYKLKGDDFIPTSEESTGETLHTEKHIRPESVERFNSVTEALEYYGGVVKFIT